MLDSYEDNFLCRIILRDCLVFLESFCTSIAGWEKRPVKNFVHTGRLYFRCKVLRRNVEGFFYINAWGYWSVFIVDCLFHNLPVPPKNKRN